MPTFNVDPSLLWVPPYVLTRVVDPFGRTATFDYGCCAVNARLNSITDSIGLTSSFRYDYNPGQADLGMTNLITPYGTTTFLRGSFNGIYRANWVEITYPNGEKERVEYSEKTPAKIFSSEPLSIVPKGVPVRNFILWARNTYHWDRKAYAEGYAPDDYTKARIYHWTHGLDYNTASGILESFKAPLEHRIWFNYNGQVNPTFVGSSDQPTKIARTVEDGTTQLYQFEYNSRNKPTKAIDPLGREITFIYDTNDVDLTEVRQTRAGQNELLFSATYNAQHQPRRISDAARQTTSFGYNTRGQVLAMTNALGHAVGDQIIERVAQILREQARSDDLIAQERLGGPRTKDLHARFGGDEFCFLIPDLADYHQAHTVGERFRDAVERFDWALEDRRLAVQPPRVDVGVVCLWLGRVAERRFIASRLAADLIQRADKLMYEAKGERASHIYLLRAKIENGELVEIADGVTEPVEEPEP